MAIDAGACGCTQDPSYVWKMLNHAEGGAHAKELLKSFEDAWRNTLNTIQEMR